MSEKRTIWHIEKEINEQIIAYNEANLANDLPLVRKIDASIIDLEKEYAKLAALTCFDSLVAFEKPMLKAIEVYSYTVVKHKDNKDNETNFITRELASKEKQIDLVAFDNYCKEKKIDIAPNKDWRYAVQKFNQLLCMRAGKDLGVKIDKIKSSFYMNDIAKKIEMGATPTSNTAMLKQLQGIIDMMLYEEGEKGNIYKASSKDVAYLNMLYTKKGKTVLSIATAKHSFLNALIMDILHKIVCKKNYTIECKLEKSN